MAVESSTTRPPSTMTDTRPAFGCGSLSFSMNRQGTVSTASPLWASAILLRQQNGLKRRSTSAPARSYIVIVIPGSSVSGSPPASRRRCSSARLIRHQGARRARRTRRQRGQWPGLAPGRAGRLVPTRRDDARTRSCSLARAPHRGRNCGRPPSGFRRAARREALRRAGTPPAGFVTLPGSGQEGARAEFRSGLDDRSLPVRHRFGSELSQG